jgi:hypothetical protein
VLLVLLALLLMMMLLLLLLLMLLVQTLPLRHFLEGTLAARVEAGVVPRQQQVLQLDVVGERRNRRLPL